MIFVTGGTGLVGMHAVASFLRRGERLRLLVREGSDRDPLLALLRDQGLSQEVMWVEGDLFDTTFLVEAMEGCTAVFHAAAISGYADGTRVGRRCGPSGQARTMDRQPPAPGVRLPVA